MASLSSRPSPGLPMAGQPTERSDAAANRERILCAARTVLAEHGAEGLSMNAVAAAAGVGKGTIFRRFGDRDGLIKALLNVDTAELQDAFLLGPPPLGPGAPPAARLEAFVRALVAFQVTHLEIVLAAERRAPESPPPYATFMIHVASLIRALDPRLDASALAGLILSSVAPQNLQRLLRDPEQSAPAIADAAVTLLRGVTGCA